MKTSYQKYLVLVLRFGFIISIAGCSITENKVRSVKFERQIALPSALNETSGLYCPADDTIYTINDSGNTPVLFELNANGEIRNERLLNAKNRDWEAITGNSRYIFIGDIGNNAGKRQNLNIIKLDKRTNQITSLNFTYSNNEIENNEYVKHDFDAEALVSAQNNLYLFSKSWQSNKLYIYKIDTQAKEQALTAFTTTDNLPGVVTGVDYNPRTDEFIVVGYSVNAFKMFTPFIAVLNKNFELSETIAVKGVQQVEGICVSPNGAMWISQERSFLQGAKLFKLVLIK